MAVVVAENLRGQFWTQGNTKGHKHTNMLQCEHIQQQTNCLLSLLNLSKQWLCAPALHWIYGNDLSSAGFSVWQMDKCAKYVKCCTLKKSDITNITAIRFSVCLCLLSVKTVFFLFDNLFKNIQCPPSPKHNARSSFEVNWSSDPVHYNRQSRNG